MFGLLVFVGVGIAFAIGFYMGGPSPTASQWDQMENQRYLRSIDRQMTDHIQNLKTGLYDRLKGGQGHDGKGKF